ncbi:MAG TPA: hypothetical protein VF171_07065 [Trueperaceae bacterium]
MPSYPFIILGLLFVAIITLPPLIAAIIDMRRSPEGRQGKGD